MSTDPREPSEQDPPKAVARAGKPGPGANSPSVSIWLRFGKRFSLSAWVVKLPVARAGKRGRSPVAWILIVGLRWGGSLVLAGFALKVVKAGLLHGFV